jgi:predicted MPP superfamily phosphohydrolase
MSADSFAEVPEPRGPLSGRARSWRRRVGITLSQINGLLGPTPVGRLWRSRLVDEVELSRFELGLARGGDALDGLRVAFLSDLHAGNVLEADDLEVVFERVACERPDLLLLGGDLVNSAWREVRLYERALARVAPPLGMFAVPGNHEYYRAGDRDPWEAWLSDHGVEVLLNRGRRVERAGASLWIAGVDDLTEGRPDVAAALLGRRDGEPAVLLSHHPDEFVAAAAADVELTLSGHTHGGQIRIAGWSPLHHSRLGYERGMYERGPSRLIVSRGVGVTALPFRIGATPEIVLVTLRVA